MTIKDLNVGITSLKTSNCYTGAFLEESYDKKLIPLKYKLIKKAIKEHKKITACSPLCFQIYNEKLLFWFFNSNETIKTVSETIPISFNF